MSLSMPMTRNSSWANRLTVSEPINPAEPVTITERMQTSISQKQSSGLLFDKPRQSRGRPDPGGGVPRRAGNDIINQLRILARTNQKADRASLIDHWEGHCQPPAIEFRDEVGDHHSGRVLKCRCSGE